MANPKGRGVFDWLLWVVVLALVVGGLALPTQQGRCELAYWTEFRALPGAESAANLYRFFPQKRACEAEDWVYARCKTPQQANEYLRAFPQGRYRRDVLPLLLQKAGADPSPKALFDLIKLDPGSPTATAAWQELRKRPTDSLAGALAVYLGQGEKIDLSVQSVAREKGRNSKSRAAEVIEQRAQQAVEDTLQSTGFSIRPLGSGETAHLVVETEVSSAGIFNNGFVGSVEGFNTNGTVHLKGGSWNATFFTFCPNSAKYETKVPYKEFAQFQAPPPDAMLNVNSDQVYGKIVQCLSAVRIEEKPEARLNEALQSLKQLESGHGLACAG